ncbi:XisI protein [Anabaena cylindrica UHCC 0172]|uniref:XisI protein n=1 Tax=Anabaena cylindrica TaxID=1165 RepID=UPI002B1FE580|nr:XisI protein [Anabaena cylindrica]MEA5554228.1 XisI protein [Anabaena cylindrica UHCC 0172]
MDKLEKYRNIVASIVDKHAKYKPSHGKIESLSICDRKSDNYLLMDTGWDQTGRVHAVVFHLRIIDDKFYIEWDGTEGGITTELLELGVVKDDIVLGFIRPEYRQFTDFSVA